MPSKSEQQPVGIITGQVHNPLEALQTLLKIEGRGETRPVLVQIYPPPLDDALTRLADEGGEPTTAEFFRNVKAA